MTIGSRPSSLGSLNQDIWSLESFKQGSIQADPELEPEISQPARLRIIKRHISKSSRPSSHPSPVSVEFPSSIPHLDKPARKHKYSSVDLAEMQERSYSKRICFDENCPIEGMHSADRFDIDRLAKEARPANIPVEILVNSPVPKEIVQALERIRVFKETEAYRSFEKDLGFLKGCKRVHHRWGY